MLVQQILGSKASAGVTYLPATALVKDAVKLMSEKRIGTVVVSKDGANLDGILSERDVVRELGQTGAGILDAPVSDLMTSKLVTCVETDLADDILQKMTDGRFRHMPVMRDGAMIGLISIGDVVKARLSELSMEKDALQGMIMGH